MFRFVTPLLGAALLFQAYTARADDSGSLPAPAPEAQAVAPAVAAASAVQAATAASQAQPQQHCWREYRVGSAFPKTRCESGESEADIQHRLAEWNHALERANQVIKAPGP